MTFPADDCDCDWYIGLMKYNHAASECAYNTPRSNHVRGLYRHCIEYRFLKSLGADSVCADRHTIAHTCSLFGFMKEWLQEGGVSTDNAMIHDTDTIVQQERRLLTNADCEDYDKYTKSRMYDVCADNSMVHETNPKHLSTFTDCITTHFMTKLGARSSCIDDSGQSDYDTMTLLRKDRLFYSFMEEKLKVGNICQATNDVTFPADDCDTYIHLVKKQKAATSCAYNMPRSNRELSYTHCLNYRFLKSLGAESVCVDRKTLAYMCSLFGFMKEWLQKGGVSTDNAMIHDTDTLVQKERLFTDADCDDYDKYTKSRMYDVCADNSMLYETLSCEAYGVCAAWYQTYTIFNKRRMKSTEQLSRFTDCITIHFMTKLGARSSCIDNSVRSDNDTNVDDKMTLSTTDRLFNNFMVETLKAGSVCQS